MMDTQTKAWVWVGWLSVLLLAGCVNATVVLNDVVPVTHTWKQMPLSWNESTNEFVYTSGLDKFVNFTFTEVNATAWRINVSIDPTIRANVTYCNTLNGAAKSQCFLELINNLDLNKTYSSTAEFLQDCGSYPLTLLSSDPNDKLKDASADLLTYGYKETVVEVPVWKQGVRVKGGTHSQMWDTSEECNILGGGNKTFQDDTFIYSCDININESTHFEVKNATLQSNQTASWQYNILLGSDSNITFYKVNWGVYNNLYTEDDFNGAFVNLTHTTISLYHRINLDNGLGLAHIERTNVSGIIYMHSSNKTFNYFRTTGNNYYDWYSTQLFNSTYRPSWLTFTTSSNRASGSRYWGLFDMLSASTGWLAGSSAYRYFPVCVYGEDGFNVGSGHNLTLWKWGDEAVNTTLTDEEGCGWLGYRFYNNTDNFTITYEGVNYTTNVSWISDTVETNDTHYKGFVIYGVPHNTSSTTKYLWYPNKDMIADTYVSSAGPGNNYGTGTAMVMSLLANMRMMIRVNTSSLHGLSGLDTTYSIYNHFTSLDAGESYNCSFYRIHQEDEAIPYWWNETWVNSTVAPNNTQYDSTPVVTDLTFNDTNYPQWVNLNITSAVEYDLSLGHNYTDLYGFCVTLSGSPTANADYPYFTTKEGLDVYLDEGRQFYRPSLWVTYGEGTTTTTTTTSTSTTTTTTTSTTTTTTTSTTTTTELPSLGVSSVFESVVFDDVMVCWG